MHIGIAFDLKADFLAESAPAREGAPDDLFEEYDSDATVTAIERVLVARGYRFFRLGAGYSADATPAATGACDPPLPPGLWEARLLVLAGACQRCASVSVPEPKCSW